MHTRWLNSHLESVGTGIHFPPLCGGDRNDQIEEMKRERVSLGIGDESLSIDLELHLVWETVRRISLRTPEGVGSSD
jgi:hypothetical protein